jgi:hypothetical protein
MSTFPLHAASAPQLRPFPAIAKLGAFLMLIVDTYADAQQSMREAQRKYPYAGI